MHKDRHQRPPGLDGISRKEFGRYEQGIQQIRKGKGQADRKSFKYSPGPSKKPYRKIHLLLTSNKKTKGPGIFNFQNTLLICINFTIFMQDNKDY